MKAKQLIWVAISIVVAVIVSFLPPPALPPTADNPDPRLSVEAMRYMGIFLAYLMILVTRSMPDWVASILAMCSLAAVKACTVAQAFSAFGQSTMWLIIGVFALAVALANSGLMKRIALKIMSLFPTTYNGLVLAMMSAGIVVSPLISSIIGKTNLLIPLATQVTEQAEIKERSRAALGLFTATFMCTYIIGNVFLSGSGNPAIIMGFFSEEAKAGFNWVSWFLAGSIWFVVCVVGTYLFCVTYCKPKAGEMKEVAKDTFKNAYKALGPMTVAEKQAGVILILALAAWITQSFHGVDAGSVALIAVGLCALCGFYTAADFTTKTAWPLVVFVGALLSISALLSPLNVSTWLSTTLKPILAPMLSSAWVFIPSLIIFIYVVRAVIISNNALLAITVAIFGPLVESAGISMYVLLFTMLMSGVIWYVEYQNPLIPAFLVAGGNKYVTYKEFRVVSFLNMALCLIAFTASIPMWQAMGLIWTP
ncbi:MAG: anion permease [Gracilibacteraceae bacterium]|jgi:DASS family divalent anion:Na+ symporter|nr:anion permease [Gracilibacteraceae bacterium]